MTEFPAPPAAQPTAPAAPPDIAAVQRAADAVRGEVGKAIIGQRDTVDLMLCALLAGGHILLEGPPGTAKTLLAQSFARAIGLDFGRIQFTPDLMPGDILGSNLFNFQTSSFTLTRGPIFCDVLLADEINRTPPKTQAALLEAMQERAVTIDGERYPLGAHFLVIATQNPIEQHGAYPLPEAQLDRFLFKHLVDYPSLEEEIRIVTASGRRTGMSTPEALGVAPVLNGEALEQLHRGVAAIRLSDEIAAYAVALIRATRDSADFEAGASPRAGAMLAAGARARAALEGRDYVLPDDVKALAPAALRHRVILSPAAEIDGRTADAALAAVIERVDPPR